MIEYYEKFCNYLVTKKKTSDNTLSSYKRDVKSFIEYLLSNDFSSFNSVSANDIDKYIKKMKKDGKSDSTVSRNMSSLRCFFKYLILCKEIDFNPTIGIKSNTKKVENLPSILSSEEIDILLSSPDTSTAKGKRDKAMLEVLYATGIRVSELISIKITDLNLDVGYILINKGSAKERAVPLYPIAVSSLIDYIDNGRKALLNKLKSNTLFLNSTGAEMTRQGFWKIIKQYQSKCNISNDITPKVLRHSFATHLLENGADIYVIKDILGHSAISSTKVYTKVLKNKYLSVYENCHPRAKHM